MAKWHFALYNNRDNSGVQRQGIAARAFDLSIGLNNYCEVTSADMVNGMLVITIERNIPEKKKPKQITIT